MDDLNVSLLDANDEPYEVGGVDVGDGAFGQKVAVVSMPDDAAGPSLAAVTGYGNASVTDTAIGLPDLPGDAVWAQVQVEGDAVRFKVGDTPTAGEGMLLFQGQWYEFGPDNATLAAVEVISTGSSVINVQYEAAS